MAGAGKRTFIAGEVLTAAQVNDYLMDQAVMRFSGSAARAASITAPTEGMVTYLDDVNRLYIYDGAAWQEVGMEADDLRNLISASGQLFVGLGNGSVTALPVGADGTVLHADVTASTGVAWKVVEAGGAAVYFQVASTGVRALPTPLTPGFYRIQTSTTTSWTDQQWRFMDTKGQRFGATITGGAGFFTIPVQVASLDITTGTTPFNVLIEEILGVTGTLLPAPTVNSFTWTELYSGSATFTTASAAASIGVFDVLTGRFINLGAAASAKTGASIVGPGASLSNFYDIVAVQANPSGVWSTASVTASTRYPFAIYTGNATYVTPPWSTSADVLLVAGGGGGGAENGPGGGGAGGAIIYNAVPTTGSVSVVVGAGAGQLANGSPTSFGPVSATGGGSGGRQSPSLGGGTGGSGGGGGPAGSGTPGQGNSGGIGNSAPFFNSVLHIGGGGGGKGSAGTNGNAVSIAPGSGGSGSVMYGVAVSVGGPGGNPGSPGAVDPAYGSGGVFNQTARSGVVIVKAN